jgi:hypothetical protein
VPPLSWRRPVSELPSQGLRGGPLCLYRSHKICRMCGITRLFNLNDRAAFRLRHFRHGCSSFPSRPVDLTHRLARSLRIARTQADDATIRELETTNGLRNATESGQGVLP